MPLNLSKPKPKVVENQIELDLDKRHEDDKNFSRNVSKNKSLGNHFRATSPSNQTHNQWTGVMSVQELNKIQDNYWHKEEDKQQLHDRRHLFDSHHFTENCYQKSKYQNNKN